MCGIAGFVSAKPPDDAERVVRRMTDAIAHRGPDDSGYYADEYAFLGHRRLSIVDVAAGHQPMGNEDGLVWVTYNGEIFNHAELRPDLEARGHRYATRSDTEAIVHGWEEYGPASVARFNGMFAYAVWDSRERTLFCARDRHGIKPFYYHWDGQTFAFASEIKALLEYPGVKAYPNDAVIAEYLAFGYVSSEETLFFGVRKLMPGHWLRLRWRDGRFEMDGERYWETPLLREPRKVDAAEAVAECRERLEQCVRSRLMADVPLGVFLSGGVDSSAITALTRKMFRGPLKSFSVGYREDEFAEFHWARQVAERIGTEHHEVVIGFDEFFGALPKLIWHEDEPICFSSSVPLYFVSELARQHVKVVLTGEGSDEIFGGYERYRYHLINERALRWYGHLPEGLRRGIAGMVSRTPNLSLRRKLEHTFLYRTPDISSLYLDNFYCGFPASELAAMTTSVWLKEYSPYRVFKGWWTVEPQQSTLSRMLYADQKTYLIELLMKQDQMSMAASIESRVPFLDHTFVEFAMTLPDELKLPANGKWVLKKAVEDLLPRDIIYRPKMGFPTPLRQWLSEPRAEELLERLCDPRGLLANYFELGKLRRLVDRHKARVEDATDRIWRLLNLQIWGDVFLRGREG